MKVIVFVSFLFAFASLAECFNFQKNLANAIFSIHSQQEKREKRDDFAICPVIQCIATGSACSTTPSTACLDCATTYALCADDPCTCFNEYIQCATVAQDPTFCNPDTLYNSCKSANATCSCQNVTKIYPVPLCNDDSHCSNSKCVDKTGVGQACIVATDCTVNYVYTIYTCENQECVLVPGTAAVGYSCATDADCLNSGEVTCINEVCVGQNQGGNCTDSFSCNYGLYCSSDNQCVPQLKEGDTCEVMDDNCGYPTICGYENKCIKAFTKARGQSCASDLECVAGSACINSICAAPAAEKPCTSDSDCPINQGYTGNCECNSFTGNTTCTTEIYGLANCASEIQNLFSCVSKNSCSGFDLGNKCTATNCNNEAQCFYTCSLRSAGYPSECNPDLTCNTGTTTTGDAVTGIKASFGLIALAMAAYLAV